MSCISLSVCSSAHLGGHEQISPGVEYPRSCSGLATKHEMHREGLFLFNEKEKMMGKQGRKEELEIARGQFQRMSSQKS